MFIVFEDLSLRAAADIGCIKVVTRSGSGCSMPRRNLCGARSVDECRTGGPALRKWRALAYGHGRVRRMRAGIRQKVRGGWKLKGRTPWRRKDAGYIKAEKVDFFGRGKGRGSFLFLLFTLRDRFAQVARMLAIKGFFCTGKNRPILRGVGPDHVCPGDGLKNSPVTADDKKKRNSGDDLAAGCEEFLSERAHGRGD